MRIVIMGDTGEGRSTLAFEIVKALQAAGIATVLRDDTLPDEFYAEGMQEARLKALAAKTTVTVVTRQDSRPTTIRFQPIWPSPGPAKGRGGDLPSVEGTFVSEFCIPAGVVEGPLRFFGQERPGAPFEPPAPAQPAPWRACSGPGENPRAGQIDPV